MNLDHAIKRVHYHHHDGYSFGLAIFKAAEETGTPHEEITRELTRRRKANTSKRNAYKQPVKHW